MKRTLDLLIALISLTVLAPLLAAIAAAIWLSDRHSPFYFALRVARGGGDFRMVKFRTMIPDAWKSGVNSTASGDARITAIGKLLRRAKLDELPQLWNVLTGEMSLVGPRPQVRADVDLYTLEEARLLDTRPGVTDLASVVFADEGEILAGSPHPDLLYNRIIRPWKSRLALLYLDHQSAAARDLEESWASTALSPFFPVAEALRAIVLLADALGADREKLIAMSSSRRMPLEAWPPPGAVTVAAAHA